MKSLWKGIRQAFCYHYWGVRTPGILERCPEEGYPKVKVPAYFSTCKKCGKVEIFLA